MVVIREVKPDEGDMEARSDFDREFAKMLADTADSRRERKTAPPIFDTAVPHIKRNADGSEQSPAALGNMAFTLLSKKGNRPQVRNVHRQSCYVLNLMLSDAYTGYPGGCGTRGQSSYSPGTIKGRAGTAETARTAEQDPPRTGRNAR